MLKMTTASGKTACSVCLAEYKNVRIHSRQVLSPLGKVFIAVTLIHPCLGVPVVWRTYDWMLNVNGDDADLDIERLIETLIGLTAFFFCLFFFLYLAFLYNRGEWRFWRVKRVSVHS